MTETCSNCRFGHVVTFEIEDRIDAYTACREQPPEFIPPGSSQLKPVQHDGWCGRWTAKPLKRAKRQRNIPSCECGLSNAGRCAVCMTVAS